MQLIKTHRHKRRLLATMLIMSLSLTACQTRSIEQVAPISKPMPMPELNTPLPSQPYQKSVQEVLKKWQDSVTDTLPTSE